MPRIFDGGVPQTKLIAVAAAPAAPTLIAPARDGGAAGTRSSLGTQNVGTTTIYYGGPDVGASDSATQGLMLPGVPSPQTTPPTPPKGFFETTTPQPLYAICDVGTGGGSVVVYEEVTR